MSQENSSQEDKKMKKLESRIKELEKQLQEVHEKKWHHYVDEFIDNWYEKNKEQVDIGKTKLGPFTIDLMPDDLEKNLYKKTFKIMFTMFRDMTNDVE